MAKKTVCKPLTVVTVLGGVAEVAMEHGAGCIILDYDNLKEESSEHVKWERDRALERFPYGPIKKKLLEDLNGFLANAEEREKEMAVVAKPHGLTNFPLTIVLDVVTKQEVMDKQGCIYSYVVELFDSLNKACGKEITVNVEHTGRFLMITKIIESGAKPA